MVAVTGNIADMTGRPLREGRPLVRFIPAGMAMVGATIAVERGVEAWADPETGAFSVDLTPTDTMSPPRRYRVEVEYFDGGRSTRVDSFDALRLSVPPGGGPVSTFTGVPMSPATVLVLPSNDAPPDWRGYLLNSITGDLWMVN